MLRNKFLAAFMEAGDKGVSAAQLQRSLPVTTNEFLQQQALALGEKWKSIVPDAEARGHSFQGLLVYGPHCPECWVSKGLKVFMHSPTGGPGALTYSCNDRHVYKIPS